MYEFLQPWGLRAHKTRVGEKRQHLGGDSPSVVVASAEVVRRAVVADQHALRHRLQMPEDVVRELMLSSTSAARSCGCHRSVRLDPRVLQ